MVYPNKLKNKSKKSTHVSWITPNNLEARETKINQMPSQMAVQPAVAIFYTHFTDKGEPHWLTSQCYEL